MKKETHKIKMKMPKKRKRWLINPTERVHRQKGYKRSKVKREQEHGDAYEDRAD